MTALDAKKLNIIRLRHAKFTASLLVNLPFVRCIVLNGSLAQGTASCDSDIDLLIITKRGRIFTARFLCLVAVWLTGLKRSSDERKSHAGRVCLNYFLTENFLIIPHHREEETNRYCAENYSKAILLAGDREIFARFLKMNESWMDKYLKNQSSKIKISDQDLNLTSLRGAKRRNKLFKKLQAVSESALCGQFGDKLESFLKGRQLRRIYSDPRASRFPDLIVADDREMRFHPPKIA